MFNIKIKNFLLNIYSSTPYLELLIRRIYWNRYFNHILSNINIIIKKNIKCKNVIMCKERQEINSIRLIKGLNSLNIEKGSIILVHSSMQGLANTTLTPERLILELRDIVGEEGTIVMPCFQKFRKPKMSDGSTSTNKLPDDTLEYNYRDFACWTGLLNSIFLMQPDTVRSYFPNNSLAAQGPHAKAMMEHNLEGDLPHGKNSAWEYCVRNHAKVLFLGLKADHCFTLIHTVEDILDEQWPVKDWYEKQKYKIIDGTEEKLITIRQRKLEWAKYLTERYATNEIRKSGLLYTHEFGGATVEYMDDAEILFNYLKKGVLNNKLLFFKIPRKFLKKLKDEYK